MTTNSPNPQQRAATGRERLPHLTPLLHTLLLAALILPTLQATDPLWPQFRGPHSNPTSENDNLPTHWSPTKNVEWTADIPGRGWSSPIVTAGTVFLTTVVTEGKSKLPQVGTEYSNEYAAELTKQGLSEEEVMAKLTERDLELPAEVDLHYYLYALSLETGETLWRREYHAGKPPGGRHRKNSFASETPTTDGKSIYVYAANMGLYAFGLDGEPLWKRPLEALPISLDFGTGASPILHENQLIIVHDNEEQQFIAAFDKATGEPLWRTNRDLTATEMPRRSGWVTPYIWEHSDRTELVTIGPGHAVSYDLAGKELWRLSGLGMMAIPTPFASGGLLHINGGKSSALFAVHPGASGEITAEDESVAWTKPRAGTYLPTAVAYQGSLYVLGETGILTRLDATTGEQIYKARLTRDDNAFTSSPWAYGGHIFAISETGNTYVVPAGGEFQVLHINPLNGEMAQATPAIAGDRLLIRTESHLYSLRNQ